MFFFFKCLNAFNWTASNSCEVNHDMIKLHSKKSKSKRLGQGQGQVQANPNRTLRWHRTSVDLCAALCLRLCQVIKESQLRTIYTAEEKYTVKKSTYSNKTISSNSALRPSQFLSMTIDADERRQLEDRLSVRYVIVMHGKLIWFKLNLTDHFCPYGNLWPLQAAQQQLRSVDARMKANQEQQDRLDRRDNDLRAEKKRLSELKGKKRQLEQKISTKQDR